MMRSQLQACAQVLRSAASGCFCHGCVLQGFDVWLNRRPRIAACTCLPWCACRVACHPKQPRDACMVAPVRVAICVLPFGCHGMVTFLLLWVWWRMAGQQHPCDVLVHLYCIYSLSFRQCMLHSVACVPCCGITLQECACVSGSSAGWVNPTNCSHCK